MNRSNVLFHGGMTISFLGFAIVYAFREAPHIFKVFGIAIVFIGLVISGAGVSKTR